MHSHSQIAPWQRLQTRTVEHVVCEQPGTHQQLADVGARPAKVAMHELLDVRACKSAERIKRIAVQGEICCHSAHCACHPALGRGDDAPALVVRYNTKYCGLMGTTVMSWIVLWRAISVRRCSTRSGVICSTCRVSTRRTGLLLPSLRV